jgi:PAS domain S-box-containing protein
MIISDKGKGGFGVLIRRPEMRVFWIYLPFFLGTSFVFLIYAPFIVAIVGIGLGLILGIVIFLNSWKIASSGWRSGVGQSELKNIVFAINDALIAYDRDFKILFFNPAAERLFGIKAEDIVNREIKPSDTEESSTRRLTQVIYPSLAPIVLNRTQVGIYPQVHDISFEDPVFEIQVTTTPISDEFGNLSGFVKIVRDKTREIELMKSKGEFITIASHQIQSPVTNINWALEELGKESGLSENSKMLLQNASNAGHLLATIVQDLLSVARMEEGRFGYDFEETDATDFLGKLLAQVLPQANRAGIKLYFDQPKSPLPPVIIDSKKITLVVTNLLDNAIRYNVQNGEIVVKAEKQDDEPFVKVSIKDTGIGIPSADINKIFGKFFRADNALKFRTEGSGLGLYISKNVIQGHGGQMWVESEMNRGSVFYFTLPTDRTIIPPSEIPTQ